MRSLLIATALGSLLCVGCGTTPPAPQTLIEARSAVRSAQFDPLVVAHAPLELQKATDSIARANRLLADDARLAEIRTVSYVATQQARTAQALARARANVAAMSGAGPSGEPAHAGEAHGQPVPAGR